MKLKRIFLLTILLCFAAQLQAQDHVRARAKQYEQKIVETARKYKIDPKLLWTICYLESRFRPTAKSPKGALGLMQLLPSTAAQFGIRDAAELFEPEKNIETAARFLATLVQRYGSDNLDQILAAYNAGAGAVDAFSEGKIVKMSTGRILNPRGIQLRIPPYEETKRYVSEGMRIYKGISATGFLPEGPAIRRPQAREIVGNTKPRSKPEAPVADVDIPVLLPVVVVTETESIYFDEVAPAKPAPITTLEKKVPPQPAATGVRALFFNR